RDEDVDIVGLSVLSGSHRDLVPRTVRSLRDAGVLAPVVVGGIIPDADRAALLAAGVARVYTPKDFRLTEIVAELAELAGASACRRGAGVDPTASPASPSARCWRRWRWPRAWLRWLPTSRRSRSWRR